MSNTPYKDELIRIATTLGLPDDTDPGEIAEAVAALAKTKAEIAASIGPIEEMRDNAAQARDALDDALGDLGDAVERARTDLIQTGGVPAHGLAARMTRIYNDLGVAMTQATDAASRAMTPAS